MRQKPDKPSRRLATGPRFRNTTALARARALLFLCTSKLPCALLSTGHQAVNVLSTLTQLHAPLSAAATPAVPMDTVPVEKLLEVLQPRVSAADYQRLSQLREELRVRPPSLGSLPASCRG